MFISFVLFSFVLFFSDAVVNYFKTEKTLKKYKKGKLKHHPRCSCYERKRRQNIHQVFTRVKSSFNHREWRSQIWPSQLLFVGFYLSPLLVSSDVSCHTTLNPQISWRFCHVVRSFVTCGQTQSIYKINLLPAGFNRYRLFT